jgi:hypothetical protein
VSTIRPHAGDLVQQVNRQHHLCMQSRIPPFLDLIPGGRGVRGLDGGAEAHLLRR